MFLNPTRLAALARAGNVGALREARVDACFECGSCAFACPSHIPLTELIRTGKSLARKARS
jgi:electron transport complex protein RnfC